MERWGMEILREARIKMGLSQEALARKLNVSLGAVSGWENGKRKPSYKMIKRLADIFGSEVALGQKNKDEE